VDPVTSQDKTRGEKSVSLVSAIASELDSPESPQSVYHVQVNKMYQTGEPLYRTGKFASVEVEELEHDTTALDSVQQ
jgi:hypothetical protein